MNESCRRFETEGLARLEAGAALDAHDRACPDCLQARRAFDVIASALVAGPPRRGPRPGWQAQLLATVRASQAQPRRRASVLAPLLAGAVVVVLAGWWALRPAPPTILALHTEVVPSSGPRQRSRTEGVETTLAPAPGDRWILRGSAGRFAHHELRVWKDQHDLVLRCPQSPSCAVNAGAVEGTLMLAPGRYQAFAVVSNHPLPPPASDLGQDLDALVRAGARIEKVPPLLVW